MLDITTKMFSDYKKQNLASYSDDDDDGRGAEREEEK